MSEISPEEAKSRYGISTYHQIMENGERRFRLIDTSGFGYVRTDAGSAGTWQMSHLHQHMKETYIVQSGWVAIAELSETENVRIRLLREGEIWTAPIGAPHNIYMPARSITHVVKHGPGTADDWVTSGATKLLDKLTKPLSEEEILRITDKD